MTTEDSTKRGESAPPRASRSSLPTAQQLAETLEDLDRLWQRLVPRSARPANKGIYERIRRQLARVFEHMKIEEAEDGEGAELEDESQFLLTMRMVRMLSPEEWDQVQICMRMRRLSDVARAEVFFELDEAHCVKCGQELESDDLHENCPAEIGEEEEGEALVVKARVVRVEGTSAPIANAGGSSVGVVPDGIAAGASIERGMNWRSSPSDDKDRSE